MQKVVHKKSFKARKGGPFKSDDDAQVFGDRFEELNITYGGVTPQQIVDDARNVRSPTHEFFEWDDELAGECWRVQQARALTCSVVEVVMIDGAQEDVRSFHSVRSKDLGAVYVTIDDVTNSSDYTDQLLGEVVSSISSLSVKLRLLREHLKQK